MNTIILAAGEGRRLRPYTESKPKCMVRLAGRPLLHWQLDALGACGIRDRITVVGGYCADRLDAPGAGIVINPEFASTNMVATLMCARDRMRAGEDLLITYGDVVYEPRVLRALLAGTGEIAITADKEWQRLWRLRMEEPLTDAETFKMDGAFRVVELGKKPGGYAEVQAQYMGLIRVRGDKVAALLEHYDRMDREARYDGKDFRNMFMTSLLQHLIDAGWEVEARLVENGWLEIDSADELEKYESMQSDGSLASYCALGGAG